MITYEKLLNLQPHVFNSVGTDLHAAAEHQLRARASYDTEIATPVRSKEVWKGPGHYSAVTVLNTMSLSFDTAGTILDAAATTSVTLGAELKAAKQAAQRIATEADGYYLYVKPDGKLWPKPEITDTDPGNPVGTHAREMQQAIVGRQRLQPFMDAALERANNADRRCSNLLQRLDTDLHILVRADGTVAHRAQAANDYAYELFGESVVLLRGLREAASARHQQAVEEAEPPINDLLDFLGSLVGIDQLQEGDFLGFLGANASWFIPFGKLGQVVGKLGKAAVAGTKAAGNAGRAAARTRRVFARIGRTTRKPEVSDPKLQNFVNANYKAVDSPNRTGRGTTADAVRKELAEGGTVGNKTHVTKARDQVRGLRNWLRKNPNASEHDKSVARMILKDLEDALNGN